MFHMYICNRRRPQTGFNHCLHNFIVNHNSPADQEPQALVYQCLTLFGRQFEYFEIVLVTLFWAMLGAQQVVGDSELAGGEQIVLVTVVLEGSGLSDEPVYDMTVVDIVAIFASQSG